MIKAIDKKKIRNLENLLKVKTGEAEVMTDFRFAAMSVKRNAVSFAVCGAVYAETTYPGLFINIDAIQFEVGNGHGDKVKVNFIGQPKLGNPMKAHPVVKPMQGVACFIKFILFIAGDGSS